MRHCDLADLSFHVVRVRVDRVISRPPRSGSLDGCPPLLHGPRTSRVVRFFWGPVAVVVALPSRVGLVPCLGFLIRLQWVARSLIAECRVAPTSTRQQPRLRFPGRGLLGASG